MKIVRLICICLLNTLLLHAEPLLIGISGGSGSGKTTFAECLAEELQHNAIILSEDAYYHDLSHLPLETRKAANFDHPDAIDFSLFEQHLMQLKQGQSIEVPIYNFKTYSRTSETITVHPAPVVIVEGILLLAVPSIRHQLDLKVFIDVDDDIRVLRRLDRDIQERGRQFSDVQEQYLRTVRPMHLTFVEPSKQHADLIVPVGGHNKKAFQILLDTLKKDLTTATAFTASDHSLE
ncbi:MAG: uridine kinase [Simkania sp.]|nr:uridine kinase [Simkania sp.]